MKKKKRNLDSVLQELVKPVTLSVLQFFFYYTSIVVMYG